MYICTAVFPGVGPDIKTKYVCTVSYVLVSRIYCIIDCIITKINNPAFLLNY